MIVFDDAYKEALGRIALTPDGRVFHMFLQKAMMAISDSPDSGALHSFEGGRRFAAQIKAAMDLAIAEEPSAGSRSADQLVVIVPRTGARISDGHRGTRRRGTGTPDTGSSRGRTGG